MEDFLVHDLYSLVASAEQQSSSEELREGISQVISIIGSQHQPWSNGVELLGDAQKNKHVLPTGCEGIDMLLQGGLRVGHVTELVGPSPSGKTQVCLQAASNVAVKFMGVVMFLDTCNSFSPRRMACFINQHFNTPVEEVTQKGLKRVMSSILCQSVFDIFSLLDVLRQLELKLQFQVNTGDCKLRLLIIDSISSLITPILGGNGAHGHSLMIFTGFLLKKLAHEYNISVLDAPPPSAEDFLVFFRKRLRALAPAPATLLPFGSDHHPTTAPVTNHMVCGEGGILKPALGESWKSIPHVRLLLSHDRRSNSYNISILKHPVMVSGRAASFTVYG
ncbi:PREDICTED: DNA repair protein RAD51 homolog 4 isoform X2 [Nelumbo nucifera]|uniref:DNA repair protein RAD51 homolog 4 isoform X2 n=1 Tax=Nelumbo nucifera TaxID=4432 RepID=A0A1U8Q432_NELNU|nr:PREDICTED: DNA repair protein RAD51 homolog 4 isoform X2 [Nelumbo nucifera]